MTFDEHLDECAQCREHPFDLCPAGASLLERVGDAPDIMEHVVLSKQPTEAARRVFEQLVQRGGLVLRICETCGREWGTRSDDTRCPPCRDPVRYG